MMGRSCSQNVCYYNGRGTRILKSVLQANSRCQCDLCTKNMVPLPHACGNFAREESQVFIDAEDKSTDFEVVETVALPLPTAILSMDKFRIHQQLNYVVSMPAAVPVPFPFFPQQPLMAFSFPFPSVQQPGVLPQKRERLEQNGNSNACAKSNNRSKRGRGNGVLLCIL
jgi:hypothetical protein